MFPPCPLPQHITALYVIAVVSSMALFSQSITTVRADILVYSEESHQQIEVVFRDMPSRFGDSLPLEGLKGYFVYAEPAHACTLVKPPPPGVLNSTENWILLIMRGNCSFEMKVRMAQQSKYDAAIVHNVNSSDLEPMSATNSTGIRIPSVFVGENTGFLLKANYQYDRGYYVLINDDMPFNINTHLLLPFATVVGICCLIMIIFMVLKCLQNRRRQRRHRLPSSSLRQIPTSKFRKGDPYETCAICLEDYQEGEKLRILPCSHAYHSKCIDPWLTRNRRVCPVCKRKVFAQDERISDSDSDSDADDTTPLVRPSSLGTQGGTFDASSPNTFLHPNFSTASSSSTSSASTSSASAVIAGLDEEAITEALFRSLFGSRSDGEPAISESSGQHNRGAHHNKGGGRRNRGHDHEQQSDSSSESVSVHTIDFGSSAAPAPNLDLGTEEENHEGAMPGYDMSSGEHSINSRPTDLDFSDDHFEGSRSSGLWGSHTALLGSIGEPDASVEHAEVAKEVVSATDSSAPTVTVRTSSSSQDSGSGERKPAVV